MLSPPLFLFYRQPSPCCRSRILLIPLSVSSPTDPMPIRTRARLTQPKHPFRRDGATGACPTLSGAQLRQEVHYTGCQHDASAMHTASPPPRRKPGSTGRTLPASLAPCCSTRYPAPEAPASRPLSRLAMAAGGRAAQPAPSRHSGPGDAAGSWTQRRRYRRLAFRSGQRRWRAAPQPRCCRSAGCPAACARRPAEDERHGLCSSTQIQGGSHGDAYLPLQSGR